MGRSGKKRSVAVPVAWRPVKSQRRARQITSVFHQLTHAKEAGQQQQQQQPKRMRAEASSPAGDSESDDGSVDDEVEQDGSRGGGTAEERALARQLQALGGRRLYQAASALATARNTSSAKWIFKTLTALGRRPEGRKKKKKKKHQRRREHEAEQRAQKADATGTGGQGDVSGGAAGGGADGGGGDGDRGNEDVDEGHERPTLLEVGAVNTQLLACRWLDVTPIDLRSQHPQIRQVDFLRFGNPAAAAAADHDVGAGHSGRGGGGGGGGAVAGGGGVSCVGKRGGRFDFISCAMVLNCVPSPEKRGAMLLRSHALLNDNGLLFVVLPRRCLEKSVYITEASFVELMKSLLGFELAVLPKKSPKIVFMCFEKKRPLDLAKVSASAARQKRRQLRHPTNSQHRPGNNNNNGSNSSNARRRVGAKNKSQKHSNGSGGGTGGNSGGGGDGPSIVGHSTAFAVAFDVETAEGRRMAGLPPLGPATPAAAAADDDGEDDDGEDEEEDEDDDEDEEEDKDTAAAAQASGSAAAVAPTGASGAGHWRRRR